MTDSVEIPQHIKEAAADALAVATNTDYLLPGEGGWFQDELTVYVAAVLAAVWPLIETHVREQVASEIEAVAVRENRYAADWCEGMGDASWLARGAARDGDTRG